jgi:hypothetical protein
MKSRSVYKILCDMFPKKDVDYAIRAAKEKRPPNLKHFKDCILDRDHLDKCRTR